MYEYEDTVDPFCDKISNKLYHKQFLTYSNTYQRLHICVNKTRVYLSTYWVFVRFGAWNYCQFQWVIDRKTQWVSIEHIQCAIFNHISNTVIL